MPKTNHGSLVLQHHLWHKFNSSQRHFCFLYFFLLRNLFLFCSEFYSVFYKDLNKRLLYLWIKWNAAIIVKLKRPKDIEFWNFRLNYRREQVSNSYPIQFFSLKGHLRVIKNSFHGLINRQSKIGLFLLYVISK